MTTLLIFLTTTTISVENILDSCNLYLFCTHKAGFSLTKNYYPSQIDIAKKICKILKKKINLKGLKTDKEHDKPQKYIGAF